MDAYFPVSNMQADTMQTLYLMNTSVGGYTDALVSENLMLSSNSTNTTSPTSDFSCNEPAHGQPVEMTFSLPSHESCRHVREKSAAQQQTLAANLLTLPLETRPFSSWLGGGNMLTYFQPADSNSSSHSINRDLNGTIGICHSNVAEIPQIEMRGHTLSSVNGHHSGLIPTQSCLQLDQPTTTALQRQGLSLSLSSQDTSNLQLASFRKHCSEFDVNCQGNIQPTLEENSLQTDTTVRKGMTASGVTGVMDSIHKTQENKEFQSSSGQFAGFFHSVKNSKYLAATQELLNEVLNLTKFESFKPLKQRKSQSLIGTTIEKENTGNKLGRKNLDVDGDRTHKDSMEGMDSPNKEEANVTERKELQNKKTKLVAMLDEVDWRYKQYHHQMQTVISSFEAVTQIGAAKTYTALALKTICRHFRSLRDAIVGQINVTSKELGEQHTSCSGDSGGSHVRLVQLGMIQPHAWRPQRGLPEKAVTVLRAWLFEHFLHPYPKDSDKLMLAKQAGLTRSQVSNWFINARVRLWKPMVEEMYMEELKETGLSIEKDSRFPIDEQANGIMERDSAKKLDDSGEQTEQKHIDGGAQNEIFEKPMIAENRDLKSQHPKTLKQSMDQRLDLEAESNAEISPEASDVGVGQGHLKKARNESKVSVNSLSNCSTIVNFSTSEGCQESVSVNLNNRVFSDNDFGLSQRDIVLSSQNSKSGPFELDCMNRFGNGSFISSFSGGNVSLTLGLQQSENLTLSKAQQRCVPSEGCFELGHYSDHLCNINDTAAIDASNSYNCDMENRKRFSTYFL